MPAMNRPTKGWENRLRNYAIRRGWHLRQFTPPHHPDPTYILLPPGSRGLTREEVEETLNYKPRARKKKT